MASGKDIIDIACGELGYKEGKIKDNKYGKWYGLNNDAWCMIFCQWVYAKAGIPLPYKTASCGALLRWYQNNQPECIVNEPRKGCLVIFDLPNTKFATDHVGLYESSSGKYITTIDGNTSSTNDANGGYVNRRTRHVKYVHAYIVPRELEEEMKRYQTLDEILTGAKWAYQTIKDLCDAKVLCGTGSGLDLSEDMLRMFVINDRAGLYEGVKKK